MKRRLAILLCAALLVCACGLAEERQSGSGPLKIPVVGEKPAAPEETDAPEATDAPEPTEEPEPAETPESTDEPEPTDAPEATDEPEPTDTPEPTATPEPTEAPEEDVKLWFEEGFALTIPAGWVCYPVASADMEQGLRAVLGDGSGEHYVYVEVRETTLGSIDDLPALIEKSSGLELTEVITFGERPFAVFVDSERDLSGCATMWGNAVVSILCTPRDDGDFGSIEVQIAETFETP